MKGTVIGVLGLIIIVSVLFAILSTEREGFANVIDYFSDVSAGGHHTVILTKRNTVVVCGYNKDGRLGVGDTTSLIAPMPVAFPPFVKVKQIFTGNSSTFFIIDQNRVYASGNNDTFKLGINESSETYYAPTEIMSVTNIVKIGAGWNHTIFLSANNQVYGCGSNNVGQLAIDATFSISRPTLITSFPSDVKIVDISANSLAHSIFLDDKGVAYTCGWNWHGQLGNGTKANTFIPKALTIFPNPIKAIFTGATMSFFITTTDQVYACGNNYHGQLALSNYAAETTIPSLINFFDPSQIKIKTIAVGLRHTVFLSDKGIPYVIGDNTYGQLGTSDYQSPLDPTIPKYFIDRPSLTVHKITTGNYHTLFLTSENVLLATGLNNTGQLGIGDESIDTINTPTPCNIPIETPTSNISLLRANGYAN